ncbi:hypothetical protein [Photobacterium kasasachensis]|uniref:hypothetical protein n=1 Tax=Photobacterium kasasachensis TaxID=2910240 RepID=UPI003D10450A
MNKKILVLLLLFIGGCASRAPVVDYSEPEDNYSKLSYKKDRLLNRASIGIYEDYKDCKRLQPVDYSRIVDGKLKVESDQPITIQIVSGIPTHVGVYTCLNRFSFTPEKDHTYTIKQKLVVEVGYCTVNVYDDESNEAVGIYDRSGLFGCLDSQLDPSEKKDHAATKLIN